MKYTYLYFIYTLLWNIISVWVRLDTNEWLYIIDKTKVVCR